MGNTVDLKIKLRTDRVRSHTDALNSAGLFRTAAYRLVGGSLRETQGQTIQMRRARAAECLLDNVMQNVFPDEPFVGSMMGLWTLEENLPSYEEQKLTAIEAIEDYLGRKAGGGIKPSDNKPGTKIKPMEQEVSERQARWALMSRVHHDASLNYGDYQRMLADMESHFSHTGIERYEIGKVLEASLRIRYDQEDVDIMNSLPWLPGNHLGLDYEVVLVKGFAKMQEEVDAYHAATDDSQSVEFYEAVTIVLKSMVRFFERYADNVRGAAKSGDYSTERREELNLMADILEKMSHSPAGSFREALQAVWLLHVMSNIVGGSAMSFSRFDQYMLPFYERDIKAGVPREELKELLECFWIKINEPKLRTVQSMTVGGLRPDGACGCTDLTRLCLEVARDMKLPYPNIAVRVSKTSPDWLYGVIIDTIKAGCGQPMILNDDVFSENFKKLGYPPEIANDYFNMGCVELMIQGKQPLWGAGGGISYMECLQQTLDAYKCGELRADTFDGFLNYFINLIQEGIKKSHEGALVRKKNLLETNYDPFCSILTQDCIARGRDMHHGGSACPTHWSMYGQGIGTMTDSLVAIKKFVYDEKKLTLDALIEALDRNFVGFEDIHVMLDRDTPSFGNDIDETDEIAAKVFYELTKAIFDLNSLGGEDKYVSTFFSYFSHVLAGEVTGATPNGRLAGQSFSDSMAPTQGKDVNGPTKLLNSILKIDPSYVTGGYALNLKVNPALTKNEQGINALKGLLKAYIFGLGPQIQVNYVDADALREAQTDPGKHRNIVVRVGGYCEYFVNLDKVLQDEIIERTVHDAI